MLKRACEVTDGLRKRRAASTRPVVVNLLPPVIIGHPQYFLINNPQYIVLHEVSIPAIINVHNESTSNSTDSGVFSFFLVFFVVFCTISVHFYSRHTIIIVSIFNVLLLLDNIDDGKRNCLRYQYRSSPHTARRENMLH